MGGSFGRDLQDPVGRQLHIGRDLLDSFALDEIFWTQGDVSFTGVFWTRFAGPSGTSASRWTRSTGPSGTSALHSLARESRMTAVVKSTRVPGFFTIASISEFFIPAFPTVSDGRCQGSECLRQPKLWKRDFHRVRDFHRLRVLRARVFLWHRVADSLLGPFL